MTIRRRFERTSLAVFALLLAVALPLSGCTGGQEGETTPQRPAAEDPAPIKIGVLPTEDSLPLWVAEDKGYYADAGLDDVEIVVFQSAQERDAAFVSRSIDAFMGDLIAAANLEAGGSPGTILTVMLGADQSQGRFGVVVAPKSKVDTLTALADVPVGTSSATIQEFVLDGLMGEAGVDAAQVKKEEVKKVPVRFELLMAGKLEAAALPEPFVALAEQGGAKVVGDDTLALTNLSQTILFVSDDYFSTPAGVASSDALLSAWDRAVEDVNADPNAYRSILVEQARLPESLTDTYQINAYPPSQLPGKAEVDAVIAWMTQKGYLTAEVTYEDLTLITPPQQ